jgi:polysaccharide biosynthesis protein PslH
VRPKLLFVTSRIPWPLDKGDKLRAYHQLRSLSASADIYLFCVNDLGEIAGAAEELNKYCKQIHFVNISKARVGLNVLGAYFSGAPLQVGYFYNKTIQEEFNNFANQVKADVIYCQLIRTALLVKNRKERKVLDYMDVFSKGVERRIDKVNFLMRPAFKLEHKRLLNFEEKVFTWFDEKIIISSQDRDLIPHAERKKIKVIPNGVDTEFFKPQNAKKEFDILFNGNMQYPPNVEAVEYLCNRVLPLLREKNPQIKILISGTSPAPRVLALKSENVVVSGRVADVRDNFAKSKLLVAPMQSSIGLQNKLLEAMAMGIPCVTSTLANNALNATPGKEILVADAPEEYVRNIFSLLENETLYNEIRGNAFGFIENNYSWKKVNEELKKVLFA